MTKRLALALGFLGLALATGCDKPKEKEEKAEESAGEAGGEAGGEGAGDAAGLDGALACHDLTVKVNTNELDFGAAIGDLGEQCEVGCDAGDQPSCAMLERVMAALCQVKPEICTKQCAEDPDTTVGKLACSPPPLPPFMSPDESVGAARCHISRLERQLGKLTEEEAIAMGAPTQCAIGCDGGDETACAEAKVLIPKLCASEGMACADQCDQLPDSTQRTLYGCAEIGEDPAAQCAHLAKVATSKPDSDPIPRATKCAEACDASNDETACTLAEDAVKAMCGPTPELCTELCGTMTSPTLDGLLCKYKM